VLAPIAAAIGTILVSFSFLYGFSQSRPAPRR
jgi:hypothetical protein